MCSSVVWQSVRLRDTQADDVGGKESTGKSAAARAHSFMHELFYLRLSCCSQNSPRPRRQYECQSPFRMTRRRWSHDSRITASGLIKVYINKSVSYANPNHAEAAETITTDETTGRGAVGHLFLTSSCLSNFCFLFFFFVFLGGKKTLNHSVWNGAGVLPQSSVTGAGTRPAAERACVPCFHQWLNFPD